MKRIYAYMGPLFGLLSFLPAIPLYMITKELFWALIILLGSMINFFNLIPVFRLDGPIKELGYRIEGMKEYVARLEEELKETGAVHRNIYMMQHEINVLR